MARKREREETELDIVTLLNVMVVLIAFLILTAVFTQVTIQELKLPAQPRPRLAQAVLVPERLSG